MTCRFFPLLSLFALLAMSVHAGADVTVPSPSEEQLKALDARINSDAANGLLDPEAVLALQGKQQELENLAAKLKSSTGVTSDERAALGLSIKDQKTRLAHYEQMASAKTRKPAVDPASLPPPTYVTPDGTTIIAPGGNYGNSGVVISPNAPAMNPAPTNLQPVPAAPASTPQQ